MPNLLIQNEYVEIWAPITLDIEKGGRDGDGRPLGMISGIASSEIVDLDEEIIVQKGLDFSDALVSGFLTLEHPLGTLNVVGFPTDVRPTTVSKDGQTYKATGIDGALYKDDPHGKALWHKGVTMAKAGGQRSLGFSIEGRMLPGARKGNRVDGIKVKSIAISSQPRNRTSVWRPVAETLKAAATFGNQVDSGWLEQAIWKADALGMDLFKSQVGYPDQQPGANGGAAIVPQSISAKKESAAWGGELAKIVAELKANGASAKLFKNVTGRDLAVTRILKEMPRLNWSQGLNVLEAFEKGR